MVLYRLGCGFMLSWISGGSSGFSFAPEETATLSRCDEMVFAELKAASPGG